MVNKHKAINEKLSLSEKIAKAVEGKDTSLPENVIVASGGSLKTKSSSGYGQTDLDERFLKARIKLCIMLLNNVGKTINQSNVMKLLGFNKNTQYTLKNGEKRFVEELFKDINENYEHPYTRQDPGISEHMYDTMSSGFIGSIPFTPNQLIFAQHLKPIFDEQLNDTIKVYNQKVIGINYGNTINSNDLISGLLWMVLDKRKFFHHSMSFNSTYTYCEHLNNMIRIIAYSGSVHSKNKSYDYLLRMDKKYKFTELIERYGYYRQSIRSYKYRYTKTLENIMQEAVELFNKLSLAPSTNIIEDSDIIIEKDMLEKINTRDLYILLNELDGYNEGVGYIIKNSDTIKDEQNSRVYSLFTSIKSDTRKNLGFINYDISTCMQTIVAHFVDMEQYPVHQQLLDDKHSFRAHLAEELGVNIPKIKEIISAADNGHQHKKFVVRSELLKKYIEESSTLTDEFIDRINDINYEMVETASVYAKDLLRFTGTNKKGEKTYKNLGVNPYSLFFFIWTQIEREIRNAMMSCFQDFVHEVHDAVYSKELLDMSLLENAVFQQTGIAVKIEH